MNVAIIGCGAVFEVFYMEALSRMHRAGVIKVMVLVDSIQQNVERAASRFANARLASDLSQADLDGIDRALVLTPPASHFGICMLLAKAGVHVYCEKPLTTSPQEARDIAAAFMDKNLICKVGYVRRLFPNVRAVRSLYGRIAGGRHIAVSDGEVFRWPIKTASVFSPGDSGAGVVWDKLSHNLDMVQWVAGLREITSVQSSCKSGMVPSDVLVEGSTGEGTFKLAVSWTAAFANVISIEGANTTIRTKNGLGWQLNVSEPVALPHDVGSVSSYGEAVESALGEFFRLRDREENSILATSEESVLLTELLSKINILAKKSLV